MKATKVYNYIDDDFVTVDLEEINNLLFCHIKVKKFNIAVFKYILALWEQLQLDCYTEGWDDISFYTNNDKFVRAVDDKLKLVGVVNNKSVYTKKLGDCYGD